MLKWTACTHLQHYAEVDGQRVQESLRVGRRAAAEVACRPVPVSTQLGRRRVQVLYRERAGPHQATRAAVTQLLPHTQSVGDQW